MKKIITLSLLLSSSLSFASALVKLNKDTQTIDVISHFVYRGDAMTLDNVQASTHEIEQMWSTPQISVNYKGESYQVRFHVDYSMTMYGLKNITSCAYNFVQIRDKSSAGDRSYYAGLGSQHAVFYTSDNLGVSTTAAHEFGHGLFLEHNYFNQLKADEPGIMFARGTIVKPKFQWNPEALPGQPGGSINPKYRVVRDEDIAAIPFSKIVFNQDGYGCLGQGQNLIINY